MAIMSGGPAHGRTFDVPDPRRATSIMMPVIDHTDVRSFGEAEALITPVFMRQAEYRPRGRYRCGNFACDMNGNVIYDFLGER